MNESYDWLFHEHSGTEEILRECVEDAAMHNWEDCKVNFEGLVAKLKCHIEMEEQVLFPAYERLTELPQEPIEALRAEHDQIAHLLTDIHEILKTSAADNIVASIKGSGSGAGNSSREGRRFLLATRRIFPASSANQSGRGIRKT